ncbi:EF-hand domain-containing protein [Streptomyces griseus]|uniref:EF-hand domain-containing protein n=1 Tax=Streptomyces griseus TaxID=1911 RepID=UPI00368B7668
MGCCGSAAELWLRRTAGKAFSVQGQQENHVGKMTEADAETMFKTIDTDGSGEIRLRELRDYGLANDGALDGTKLAEFVRVADTDGDRRITLAEFKAYFA